MQISLVLCLLCLVVNAWGNTTPAPTNPDGDKKQLVCYYDSSSFIKEGLAKLVVDDLEPAFQLCTYIVYGYAGIERDSFKVFSTNQMLDLDLGKGLFRVVTRLKRKYPDVKVLLSVGGDKDIETSEDAKDLPNKYLELLENSAGRTNFVKTALALVTTYGFDGLDIAFQFPKNKPKKVHGKLGSFWKGFKKVFSGDHIIDEHSETHKEQFTGLMRDLKNEFRKQNYVLSTTVLPNVNSSLFYDVHALANYVDFVNLGAFDFYTPERNPEVADITAPLYPMTERNPEFNAEYQLKYWLKNGYPAYKINLVISTHGRVWKLTEDSGITGVPPVENVENDAPLGPNSQTKGLYSWQEVCSMLPNDNNKFSKGADAPLRKISDTSRRTGVYAFRAPDKNGNNGIWVSYEDPDTAAEKAAYVKNQHFGGVALIDLSNDDFRGLCTGDKYPILRAIKYRLTN